MKLIIVSRDDSTHAGIIGNLELTYVSRQTSRITFHITKNHVIYYKTLYKLQ